jgi:hypothetical protein
VVFLCLGLAAFVSRPVAARALRATVVSPDGSDGASAEAEKSTRAAKAQEKIARLIEKQSVRPVDAKVVEDDAQRIVKSMRDEQIQGFLGGESLTEVLTAERYTVKIASGQVTAAAVAAPTLGDSQSDLVFVPVSPCRIIDTRLAGGVIAPGPSSQRSFLVAGTTGFENQGGMAGGCGVPQGATLPQAAAVVINFVAVGPQGPGDMRAWPYGQPRPTSSIINYAQVGGLNIANGLVVPISGVATQPDDITVQADVSGAYLVADVTGYFTRFPIEQFQGSLKSSVTESNDSTLTDLNSGACIAVNHCTVTAPANGKVVVSAYVGVVADHTSGTADKVGIGFETTASVTCGWQPDSANASVMTASAGLGTNSDYDMTLSHGATFPISSGATQDYYLSIKWLTGANSGDQYENSRLICTFIPN